MINQRRRILEVYRGATPDVVPFMLDLSHWFYQRHGRPWDLSKSYDLPERELIDYHKKMGVGFYRPNLASFFKTRYREDVRSEVAKKTIDGKSAITWSFTTPRGRIERTRVWHEHTYTWHVNGWNVRSAEDLLILADALSGLTYEPIEHRYQAWTDELGEIGVAYFSIGNSGMGQLLNHWMGIERTMLAASDWPAAVRSVVDSFNESLLRLVDLAVQSQAEVLLMSDNFSSDVQPPRFFQRWSRDFYAEAIRRAHARGKFVAVHIDGRLRGAIGMHKAIGADCGDAITPMYPGDLTAEGCREEAGPDFILSGGVPPILWLPGASRDDFTAAVLRWLDLRRLSPRLIAGAGDQVPPGALEDRIELMRDLVEKHGRY